jgi:hypothetical protein
MSKRKRIEVGDSVVDPVTKIKGVAYVRSQYIQGCDRIGIQPPTIFEKNKTAVVPDIFHVDEPQLNIVKRGVIKRQTGDISTGGPSFLSKDTKQK